VYRTSPKSIHSPPTARAPSWSTITLTHATSEPTAPTRAGSGSEPPRSGIERGIRYGRGASASRKRMTITDVCAIVNASIAPKAKIPARNSMSPLKARPRAMTAAIVIATYGVPRCGCSRPTTLGIWRCVASEYVSRDSPSIVEFTAWTRTTAPMIPTA
jgi:hypothetical protein